MRSSSFPNLPARSGFMDLRAPLPLSLTVALVSRRKPCHERTIPSTRLGHTVQQRVFARGVGRARGRQKRNSSRGAPADVQLSLIQRVIHAISRYYQPGARVAESVRRTECTEQVNERQQSINQTRPHKDLHPQLHRTYQRQAFERDFCAGSVPVRSMTGGCERHWC